jgi:predicted nucleic acid-binding protein
MATKVFLDINILVDFFDITREENKTALQLFKYIEDKEIIAFTSESVLCTTLYLIQRRYSVVIVKELAKNLLAFVEIIPCNNKRFMESLMIDFDDIEDTVIYNLALNSKLDFFITNDKLAIKKLSTLALPVVSTRDFLNHIKG